MAKKDTQKEQRAKVRELLAIRVEINGLRGKQSPVQIAGRFKAHEEKARGLSTQVLIMAQAVEELEGNDQKATLESFNLLVRGISERMKWGRGEDKEPSPKGFRNTCTGIRKALKHGRHLGAYKSFYELEKMLKDEISTGNTGSTASAGTGNTEAVQDVIAGMPTEIQGVLGELDEFLKGEFLKSDHQNDIAKELAEGIKDVIAIAKLAVQAELDTKAA